MKTMTVAELSPRIWATQEFEHKGKKFAKHEQVAGLSAADLEEHVRGGSVTFTEPEAGSITPKAWALVQQTYAGKVWLPGERVDIGHKAMPLAAIERALQLGGLVSLTEPSESDLAAAGVVPAPTVPFVSIGAGAAPAEVVVEYE
jgi:hypothetical protein